MWMNVQQVIDEILDNLFSYETNRHLNCITSISNRNAYAQRFLYAGRTFIPEITFAMSKAVQLKKEYWPEMERLLIDISTVEEDRKLFSQTLFTLIPACADRQELRDTLSDCVVECVPFLAQMSRLRPEGHFPQTTDRIRKNYDKIRDKMDLYARIQQQPSLATMIGYYNYQV